MPDGKPAGVACVHLDEMFACRLFESPERPAFCSSFAPEPAFCGSSQKEALGLIALLDSSSR